MSARTQCGAEGYFFISRHLINQESQKESINEIKRTRQNEKNIYGTFRGNT